jgi:hypothetical protein
MSSQLSSTVASAIEIVAATANTAVLAPIHHTDTVVDKLPEFNWVLYTILMGIPAILVLFLFALENRLKKASAVSTSTGNYQTIGEN